MTLLEICTGSLLSALAAQQGGADRIELCENLEQGGTTPSFGALSLTRNLISLPIHVLIRPRAGDFCYHDLELSTMKMDIETCKMLGMQGVVFGILGKDGDVDMNQCARLIEAARPMSVTFHRAFDQVPDPLKSLESLISLGFDRVLTSGGKQTALEGTETLKALQENAGDRIIIMPGGSVRPENINQILTCTHVKEIHSSAIPYNESNRTTTDPELVNQLKIRCL